MIGGLATAQPAQPGIQSSKSIRIRYSFQSGPEVLSLIEISRPRSCGEPQAQRETGPMYFLAMTKLST